MRILYLSLIVLVTGCAATRPADPADLAPVETVGTHSLTQADAFRRLMRWVAQSYNSAQDVVQLSDADAGTIIVRGVEPVSAGAQEMPLAYTMTMDVRDGRIRFSQQVTGRHDGLGFISAPIARESRAFFGRLRADALAALNRRDDF